MFGRKDYQQLKIITRMVRPRDTSPPAPRAGAVCERSGVHGVCGQVRDLDFAVRVVGAPLMREPDGLAMSSRNVRLQPDERTRGACTRLVVIRVGCA